MASKTAFAHKSAITTAAVDGSTMSRRNYFLTIGMLLVLGFAILGVSSWIVMQPQFASSYRNIVLPVGIGGLVASIVGMVLIGAGTKRTSIPMLLGGYLLFTVAFGATTSIILPQYNIDTVTNAFVATAGVCLIFTGLGALFPRAFEKAAAVAVIALFAVILVSLVSVFLRFDTSWIDYVTLGIFSIFIAYDTHKAATIEPNLFNAVMAATNIYLDIVNIFLAILDILDNK